MFVFCVGLLLSYVLFIVCLFIIHYLLFTICYYDLTIGCNFLNQ